MLTDSELAAEIRAGLEAVTPPAPWLLGAVEKRLRAGVEQRGRHGTARGLRIGLSVVAFLLLIALTVTAVGVFLALHRPTVPVGPGSGPVIFPTKMISPTTGWALVGSTELWRTTNGGQSWTNASAPRLPDSVVNADSNYFLDGEHAWITELGRGQAGGFYLVTFRTIDGGRTWNQGASVTDPFSPGPWAGQTFFIDAAIGWLMVSDDSLNSQLPTLYVTRDGGLHWTLVTSKAGGGISLGKAIPCGASVMFKSAAIGWMSLGVCEQTPSQNPAPAVDLRLVRDLLMVTGDGGVTWQVQGLPISPSDGSIDPPVFFDQVHGIILIHGSKPGLLATSDGGSTWSARSLPGESQGDVDFVDPNHGWAIAGPSSLFAKTKDDSQRIIPLPLYHTNDGGSTWTPVQTNIRLEAPVGVVFFSFEFVDQKIGFATLFTSSVGPSEFLKTTDGGRTWNVVLACKAGLGNTYPPPACPSSGPEA